MDYEAEWPRFRGSAKKTWSEVIEKDCQTQQLCMEKDAMERRKRRKLKMLHNSHKDGVKE